MVFLSMLASPLVWIALSMFFYITWNTPYEEVLEVFVYHKYPELYLGILIGMFLYVWLFDRQYNEGMTKVDWLSTIHIVIVNALIIILILETALTMYVCFHLSGAAYSRIIKNRYENVRRLNTEDGKVYRVILEGDSHLFIEEIEE